MANDYSYVDPDYTYTDPKTGVMRNLAGITDHDTLVLVESGAFTKRIKELRAKPLKIKNAETLLTIHKHLFQDVYEWAGKVRTVEISKSGHAFISLGYFHRAFPFIDTMIADYRTIDKNDKPALAQKLAEILDHINYLHPFREGNGRTQREFLRLLALEKGLDLDLNPPDNAEVYERYMSGTINGDVKLLAELIRDVI
ncbi:MAG: Fic family protein [Rikenellaceae bacterium]|jgi:cell filamentation protein|nr:Fic family protein [Rikenellaceae bacterium]